MSLDPVSLAQRMLDTTQAGQLRKKHNGSGEAMPAPSCPLRPTGMLVGGPGFEPGFSESESDVLPLDDPPPADSTALNCSAAGWYMQQCRGIGGGYPGQSKNLAVSAFMRWGMAISCGFVR